MKNGNGNNDDNHGNKHNDTNNVKYHNNYRVYIDGTDNNYEDKCDNTDCNSLIMIMVVMVLEKAFAVMTAKTVIKTEIIW